MFLNKKVVSAMSCGYATTIILHLGVQMWFKGIMKKLIELWIFSITKKDYEIYRKTKHDMFDLDKTG